MKGLVDVIARALVDDPAPVEVFEAGNGDEPIYRLKVGKDDLGKVIGKKGRTAKAFRTLLAAAAAKQGLRPTLEILEPERRRGPATPEADAADASSTDASTADAAGPDLGAAPQASPADSSAVPSGPLSTTTATSTAPTTPSTSS
jgi:predicted RNA-binding protein YlqC (UPF0109 family)